MVESLPHHCFSFLTEVRISPTNMKYLIVQQWNSTKGNHAGMVHMCDMLVEHYPDQYIKIEKSQPNRPAPRKNKIIRKLMDSYDRRQYAQAYFKEYLQICQSMFDKLKAGDEVFLLEYNWPDTTQFELACYIRKNFPGVRIYALSHITPSYFSRHKGIKERILKWDIPIDKQLTLGSSLSEYFVSLGVKPEKVSTGFHYVDSYYYHKNPKDIHESDKLTIITMGALQRDYGMLAEIVKRCPNVNWIICRGRKTEVDEYFKGMDNVSLKGFLAEDELRHQMDIADASLNVLEDTVGSNVITTSMAMGLVVIVSNVGSIHDYCDDNNAVFCENDVEDFVAKINFISAEMIPVMRLNSLSKIEKISISKVNIWFNSLK